MAHITAFCCNSATCYTEEFTKLAQEVTANMVGHRLDFVDEPILSDERAFEPSVDLLVCDTLRLRYLDNLILQSKGYIDHFREKPILVVGDFITSGTSLTQLNPNNFVGYIQGSAPYKLETWQHLLTVVDASKKKDGVCSAKSLTKAVRRCRSSIINLGQPVCMGKQSIWPLGCSI